MRVPFRVEHEHTVDGTTYHVTEVGFLEHLGEVSFYFDGRRTGCT